MGIRRPVIAAIAALLALQAANVAGAEELIFLDKRQVGYFEKDYQRVLPYFDKIDTSKRTEYEGYISRLENTLKPVSEAGRKHPDVIACHKKIEGLRAKLEAAMSAAPAPPPPQAAAKPAPAAQAAPGAPPLSADDKKRIADFRMEFNRLSYAVKTDLDPISLQDPAVLARATANLDKLRGPLDGVVARTDKAFLAEYARYEEIQQQYDAAVAESKSRAGKAGDVDAELALIQKHFPRDSFDPSLPKEATPDQVEEWARKLTGWLAAVEQASAFFKRAEGLSIKARSPEFQQYSYWFTSNVKGKITYALKWAREEFEAPIDPGLHPPTGGYYSTDPAYVAASVKTVEKGIAGALRLLALQRGSLGKEDPATRKQLEGLYAAMEKVAGGADAALKANRLPEPASKDPKLLAIAEKALAAGKEEWGILNWSHLVINYDRHVQEDVLHRGDWLYYYKWEEFQVTFVEKVGAEYWVRTALLKNYLLGADIEPGKWEIAASQRWNRILPENIPK